MSEDPFYTNPDQAEFCINKQITALKNLQSVIKNYKFSEMVERSLLTVSNNQKIVIVGLGKNSHIARKISDTMASLMIESMFVDAVHYFHGDGGYIDDGDLVIFISRSGKTKELLLMNEHIKTVKPESSTIMLTCQGENAVIPNKVEGFDLVITCPGVVEGDHNNLAPTTSTTVLLALLDALSVEICKRFEFTKEDFYLNHSGGSLGEQLSKHKEPLLKEETMLPYSGKIRSLLNGSTAKEYDKSITVQLETRFPTSWSVLDLETGSIYYGTVEDINGHMWSKDDTHDDSEKIITRILEIKTRCPDKWILENRELGQLYKIDVNTGEWVGI